MARSVTLTTLQTRTLQRANLEVASSSHIYSTAELTDNINEGIAEFWDFVTEFADQGWARKSTTWQTQAGVDTYAIGSGKPIAITDFLKSKGVDIQFDLNQTFTTFRFNWKDRNRYKWVPGWTFQTPVAYDFVGDALKLIPTPPGIYTATLWYVPTPPVLASGGDTLDGVNGLEEYAVLSAAIKLLLKQEQNEHAQVLMAERERQKERARQILEARDLENPEVTTDVRGRAGDHHYPFSPYY